MGHKGNGAEVLSFTMKDEAATLPRLTEIIIISRLSPWCTIVRNPGGVSLADVCATLWKEYGLSTTRYCSLPDNMPADMLIHH